MTRPLLLALSLLVLSLTACNGDDGDPATDTSAQDTGSPEDTSTNTGPDRYFRGIDSQTLGAARDNATFYPGNQADCALCHSDNDEQTGFAGYPINNSAYLASFKGGEQSGLLGAVNFCITEFMGGAELTETDPAFVSLKDYIESLSDPTITDPRPEEPEVLESEAAYGAKYSGGDPTAGEAAFDTWCAKCHQPNANNPNLTLYLAPTGSDNNCDSACSLSSLALRDAGFIAQKVRTSTSKIASSTRASSDETPGPMPFFLPSVLGDEDLRNIIAFIEAQ